MQRDPSRQEVPIAASIRTLIDNQWREIHKKIYDETPYDHDIRLIETTIQSRDAEINAGNLDSSYDWKFDLDIARFNHAFNLDWRGYHEETRNRYKRYWEKNVEQQRAFVKEVSLNGLRTILIVHGAVALGCLNVLGNAESIPSLLLAAKFGLLFSLVGIFLVGSGQLIAVLRMGRIAGRIDGWIATRIKWKRLIAIGRYTRRFMAILRYADWAIYASLLWFCTYSVILYIIIVSA